MNEPKQEHEHKNCRNLLGTLSEYIDGELSEELCYVLEQHMEGCEDCRIVVDTMRKTVDIYHQSAEADVLPGEVRKRLFKSLSLEEYLD